MAKSKQPKIIVPSSQSQQMMIAAGMSKEQRDASVAAVQSGIIADMGPGSVMTLNEVGGVQDLPFLISTGSLAIDISLGLLWKKDGIWWHGLAPGRQIEIFGAEHSGKTTLALQIVKNGQRHPVAKILDTAYLDSEHALDRDYAGKLRVDLSKMKYISVGAAEEYLEALLRLIKTRLFSVIVVDSIAALITKTELAGSEAMGQLARLLSNKLREISQEVVKSPTVVIYVNQLRSLINVPGNTTPGGRALRFYSSVRLSCARGGYIPVSSSDPARAGQYLNTETVKNKLAPPYKKAESPLYFGQGTDPIFDMVRLCCDYQVFTTTGAWLAHPCGLKANGKGQAADLLRAYKRDWYPTLKDELLTKVMKLRGQNPDGSYIPGFVPVAQTLVDEEEEALVETEI